MYKKNIIVSPCELFQSENIGQNCSIILLWCYAYHAIPLIIWHFQWFLYTYGTCNYCIAGSYLVFLSHSFTLRATQDDPQLTIIIVWH